MTTTNDAVCPMCGSKLRTAIRGDTEEISLVCGAFCGWASRDIPVRELLLTADNQLAQMEAKYNIEHAKYLGACDAVDELGEDINQLRSALHAMDSHCAEVRQQNAVLARAFAKSRFYLKAINSACQFRGDVSSDRDEKIVKQVILICERAIAEAELESEGKADDV